ncbi:2-oxo acid dehydrogenase subunit E2 [Jatrophihabitans cynanchi]|uniref:Dihydrolipoamide acetyltransferase component of pyruvate dehydrogenase complex n=1 Tax=Jatrophihabitans cynanchi TaxID=2944128 RepID=A0ABY7K4A9_9ACTN|nr:dihydrolipoamide acetyltransferase family protein [Jatrophihabitans sp. SB3-54]WAX58382.1 2-oxo acid dehydrogenase subunit E2 [Jatrophihabitans sp. SB3-54]
MTQTREFRLPDLGEGLEDGEIVEWMVKVGDPVALNQTVATVESAKALVELPSPFEGTVEDICVAAGETVPVGSVLLRIAADPADAPDPSHVRSAEAVAEPDAEPKPLVGYGSAEAPSPRRRRRVSVSSGSTSGARPDPTAGPEPPPAEPRAQSPVRALPPVRKLAKLNGVELHALAPGSGPDGRILRQDVEAAIVRSAVAATATPTPPRPTRVGFRGRYPGEVEVVRGIRKRIIAKMEDSRRTIPDASCSRDTDLTALVALRAALTEQARAEGYDVRITPFALICRATVAALRRFPTLNAAYDPAAGEIRLLDAINLGVAVDTEAGLMVANIKNAERLSVLDLAEQAALLAERCRTRAATPADLTGGTFTVNNYGSFGNDDGDPIINAPESGILGIGAIRERPWVVDGQLAVRRVARLKLVFDHRICDGGEAGRFIDHLGQLCEEPARLLLHS